MNNLLKIQFKPITAFILCLALIVTGILYVPSVSYAATTQEKLDETNEKLDELRESQNILTSDLNELNTKLDNAANELTGINSQIFQKEEEIAYLEEEIAKAVEYEETQYEAMKLRIKYMYENGSSTSSLALILEAGNMEEFLTRAEYISKISDYDRQMLKEYHENYLKLIDSRTKVQEDKANLVTLGNDAQNRQNEIKQLVNDTQKKIDTSSEEIKKAEELALQYEKQIQEEIIARQEAERKAAEEAARKAAEEAAKQNGGNNLSGLDLLHQQTLNSKINYTAEELAMLAAIIECEAANQPYEGKLAVGSVVINRINNPRWPSTMTEVLYQPNQFTPVKSGRFAIVLARGANASCIQAALDVLNNGSTIDAIYFHVVREGETGGTVIADHIFF